MVIFQAAAFVGAMTISIILPTYCERDNIGSLLDSLENVLLPMGKEAEILVVDDNSPDGTALVVQARPQKDGVRVECIVRTQERGLATAIKYGIQCASGECILVMDTDFNHSPTNIPQMIQLLDDFDLVIGSRFVKGGGMEDKKRYIYSLLYNLFVQLILWQPVRDNLSGFFAMRRGALISMDMDDIFQGYGEYFMRLIHAAQRRRLSIREVPVFYVLRQHGASKSRFGSMLRDYTRCLLSLRFEKA